MTWPCWAGHRTSCSPSKPPPPWPACWPSRPWPACWPPGACCCPGRCPPPEPCSWPPRASPFPRWPRTPRPAAGGRSSGTALAAYLDLIVISLAGGAGIEAALTYSAAAGHGWAFTRLRGALQAAQLTRRPPWQLLGQLGDDLGISELSELAASVTLAGTEGARVRASLAAKAAGLRARQLADAETAAQAATERMSLPLVLLFAGFLLLIGYPAVVHVLTSL